VTPRHRIPPSLLTHLHEVPCRDCGDVVRVRMATETSGKPFPVFCTACLEVRVEAIRADPHRSLRRHAMESPTLRKPHRPGSGRPKGSKTRRKTA
jgi:hypothetical protein